MNNNHLNQPQSICQKCKSNNQLILHNIIISPKSTSKKLCTSCVLLHYHKSICAQCFQLYDPISLNPPHLSTTTTGINRLIPCIRCQNWSHFTCPKPNVPKSPYICPSCMSPNYKYFDFKNPRINGGNSKLGIDKDATKQLLGAARIAAVTVGRAVAVARGEMERRLKEAALARIRASEVIDDVFTEAVKVETERRKEMSSKSLNYTSVTVDRNNSSNVEVKNGAVVNLPVVIPSQNVNKGGVSVRKHSSNVGQSQSKMM